MPLIDKRTIIKSEIDYDKLAAAIVKASRPREEMENQKREEALRELRKKYRIEEISETGMRGWCKRIKNNYRWIRAFLGYDSKLSTSPVMAFELMRLISSFFFFIVQIMLIVIGYILIFAPTIDAILGIHRHWSILSALYGFISVWLSTFFRIAHLEVSSMTNKELINMIFSSLMAFVAALFTVLTFIRG